MRRRTRTCGTDGGIPSAAALRILLAREHPPLPRLRDGRRALRQPYRTLRAECRTYASGAKAGRAWPPIAIVSGPPHPRRPPLHHGVAAKPHRALRSRVGRTCEPGDAPDLPGRRGGAGLACPNPASKRGTADLGPPKSLAKPPTIRWTRPPTSTITPPPSARLTRRVKATSSCACPARLSIRPDPNASPTTGSRTPVHRSAAGTQRAGKELSDEVRPSSG